MYQSTNNLNFTIYLSTVSVYLTFLTYMIYHIKMKCKNMSINPKEKENKNLVAQFLRMIMRMMLEKES